MHVATRQRAQLATKMALAIYLGVLQTIEGTTLSRDGDVTF